MSKQAVTRKITLNMVYTNKQSPSKFSKLKLSASDQSIYDIAMAVFSLQDAGLDSIYKIVENEICDPV